MQQASTRETALLTLLWLRGGQPVEIEAIAQVLYGYADEPERRAVWVIVRRLRCQLKHHRIDTILRGRGLVSYRLVRLELAA